MNYEISFNRLKQFLSEYLFVSLYDTVATVVAANACEVPATTLAVVNVDADAVPDTAMW